MVEPVKGKNSDRFSARGIPENGRNFIVYSKTKSDNPSDNDGWFLPLITGSDYIAQDVIDTVNFLCDYCRNNLVKIKHLNIYSHAGPDGFWIGSDYITEKNISGYYKYLSFLKSFFLKDGIVILDACALGFNEELLLKMNSCFGVPVRAYRDLQGPNWISPKGEGPSVVCNATKCKKESNDPWYDDSGKPIIDSHLPFFLK